MASDSIQRLSLTCELIDYRRNLKVLHTAIPKNVCILLARLSFRIVVASMNRFDACKLFWVFRPHIDKKRTSVIVFISLMDSLKSFFKARFSMPAR